MDFGARANLLACIMWALSSFLLFCYAPSARVKSSAQQLPPQVDMSNRNNETGNQTGTAAPGVPELI
jgi:Flp pilus assembly protein TadB